MVGQRYGLCRTGSSDRITSKEQSGRRQGNWRIVGARGVFEGSDPCVPIVTAVARLVLVRIVESAIVHRVDRHRAIVTPAITALFATRPFDHAVFALHRIQWVAL